MISLLVHEATHGRDRDEQLDALCAVRRFVALCRSSTLLSTSSSSSSSNVATSNSSDSDSSNSSEEEILSFFAFCFPGIASACAVLTASDFKVGHAVVCESLAILDSSICLLFTNDINSSSSSSLSRISIDSIRPHHEKSSTTTTTNESNNNNNNNDTSSSQNETFIRDRHVAEWRSSTLTNLNRLLTNLFGRTSNSSQTLGGGATSTDESATSVWRVRLALVTLAARALLLCGDAMNESTIECLLDCLVAARYHVQPLVGYQSVSVWFLFLTFLSFSFVKGCSSSCSRNATYCADNLQR